MKDCKEITVMDLLGELRKHLFFIIFTIGIFFTSSVVYNYFIAKPVYQYSTLIQLPYNMTNGMQINTCVQLLREDIGKENLSSVSLLPGTNLIKLNFTGSNLQDIKRNGDKYTNVAVIEINDIIWSVKKEDISRSAVFDIKNSLAIIRNTVNDDTYTAQSILKGLNYIQNKLENYQDNFIFTGARLVDEGKGSTNPIAPRKMHNIMLVTITGCILSVGFVMMKFLWKFVK